MRFKIRVMISWSGENIYNNIVQHLIARQSAVSEIADSILEVD